MKASTQTTVALHFSTRCFRSTPLLILLKGATEIGVLKFHLFPTLRSLVDHNVVLQFLCGYSEAMSEVVVEYCNEVVAKSFADNLGKVQSLFAVDWLIDERAYLSGINKIIPPHTVVSWSDAVGIYLQTIF